MGRKWKYGVVLDAGSSGTRLHVYRWPAATSADDDDDGLNRLPEMKLQRTKKTRPGVSSFGPDPHDIGPAHLKPLLDVALKEVPKESIPETPIYLLATAGMRLLPHDQQEAVLAAACDYLRSSTDFLLGDCNSHVQIISGETEGLYGWIAANYLLDGFDHPDDHVHGKGHHTIGFLDMGGASAQIAFAPNTTESAKHLNDLKLVRLRKMNGDDVEYNVFVATWLGFGANQARARYIDALLRANSSSSSGSSAAETFAASSNNEVSDPCLPKDLRLAIDKDSPLRLPSSSASASSSPLTLVGTGQFEQCLDSVEPLLGKDVPCEDDPCLLNGKHVPAIDFDVNHFIGVSEFWYATHGVFGKDKAYDLPTFRAKVTSFCSRDWADIETDVLGDQSNKKNKEVSTENAEEACFKAAWLISVLYEGIGIPTADGSDNSKHIPGWNVSQDALEHAQDAGFLAPFKPVDQIDGVDLSWTLGKILLHASAGIPSRGSANLPVGYASNDGSFSDFEVASLAGGVIASHGVFGWRFSLAILIFLAVGYYVLLRKHDLRRLRLVAMCENCIRAGQQAWSASQSRHRRADQWSWSSWAMGRLRGRKAGPSYERIAEEGTASADAATFDAGDFELDTATMAGSGDGHSDERHLRDATLKGTERWRSEPGAASASAGVAIPVMDRSGLAVRTESRERLSVKVQMLHAARRSRTGSPARPKK